MLMRFDPFRELDRVADELWGGGAGSRIKSGLSGMPMDAYREGDHFVAHFDLPGVDPDTIDVTVERNVLTVTAERHFDRGEEREWFATERRHGRMSRQLFLGEGLDPDRVDARYEHGVLVLTIPVAEAAKPRRVAVQAGDGQAAIDTTSNAASEAA